MSITREQFDQQRRPRFGNANPERMEVPFWEWMIRADDPLPEKGKGILGEYGLMMREGVLKSGYGPWRARDYFNIPLNREEGPIWTFERDGPTRTELPDGRIICIGGEHEDSYDPDFYIYNDVIVFDPDDQIEIYGYPKEIFPPTDFHTATLFGNRIILIGCLGYHPDRISSFTPVYILDLETYRIDKRETSGQIPGWIYQHYAELDPDRQIIRLSGGTVFEDRDGEKLYRPNFEDFELDLQTWKWTQITQRNWQLFTIRQEDGKWFDHEIRLEIEALLPNNEDVTLLPSEDWRTTRLEIQGVAIIITNEFHEIQIVIEGQLPEQITFPFIEEMRSKAEAILQKPCLANEI
jgi:hypothetical protein